MEGSDGGLPVEMRDALVSRLEDAPVRLALLFGSQAKNESTAGSDIDIAVAYEPGVADVTSVHLSLVADLTRILGRDDVDVVRLSAVDPRIGLDALNHGIPLVGSEDDIPGIRDTLEREREDREETVRTRVSEAERAIERRIEQREHG